MKNGIVAVLVAVGMLVALSACTSTQSMTEGEEQRQQRIDELLGQLEAAQRKLLTAQGAEQLLRLQMRIEVLEARVEDMRLWAHPPGDKPIPASRATLRH